jgi:hypothetical protein
MARPRTGDAGDRGRDGAGASTVPPAHRRRSLGPHAPAGRDPGEAGGGRRRAVSPARGKLGGRGGWRSGRRGGAGGDPGGAGGAGARPRGGWRGTCAAARPGRSSGHGRHAGRQPLPGGGQAGPLAVRADGGADRGQGTRRAVPADPAAIGRRRGGAELGTPSRAAGPSNGHAAGPDLVPCCGGAGWCAGPGGAGRPGRAPTVHAVTCGRPRPMHRLGWWPGDDPWLTSEISDLGGDHPWPRPASILDGIGWLAG